MLDTAVYDGRGNPAMQSSFEPKTTLLKPELVHGESEISDHTKELQKNLMMQIHEDVINEPHTLIGNKIEETSWLSRSISKMIKVI